MHVCVLQPAQCPAAPLSSFSSPLCSLRKEFGLLARPLEALGSDPVWGTLNSTDLKPCIYGGETWVGSIICRWEQNDTVWKFQTVSYLWKALESPYMVTGFRLIWDIVSTQAITLVVIKKNFFKELQFRYRQCCGPRFSLPASHFPEAIQVIPVLSVHLPVSPQTVVECQRMS